MRSNGSAFRLLVSLPLKALGALSEVRHHPSPLHVFHELPGHILRPSISREACRIRYNPTRFGLGNPKTFLEIEGSVDATCTPDLRTSKPTCTVNRHVLQKKRGPSALD